MIFFGVSVYAFSQEELKALMLGNCEEIQWYEQIIGHYLLLYFKPFALYQIIFLSIAYYIQLTRIFYMIDRWYFRLLEKIIATKVDYKEIMRQKMKVDKVKRNFEGTMCVFPFIWFYILFQVCCGIIWGFRNFENLGISVVKATVEVCLYFLFMSTAALLQFGMDYSKACYLDDNA